MIRIESLAGTADTGVHFHYDFSSDTLYLRLLAHESTPTLGEVTEEGDILLREEKTDQPVGITIISWWKRFGHGTLPDSISEISRQIEPLTKRIAA